MTRKTGSGASHDAAWLRLYAAVAALPLVLTACGGGGGGSPSAPLTPPPAPTPSPTPSASISVTPSATTTAPNGAAVTLNAVVTGSTASPTWTLNGAGTLSATSGNVITYTPPDSEDFDSDATVIVSASLAGATTQSVSLSLTSLTIAGLNWANVVAPPAGTLQASDYAAGRYVAVSDTGAALTSPDATTWTMATALSSGVATDHFNARAIAHVGGTLVAAGSLSPAPYNTSTSAVATSTDGVTWTMTPTPAVTTPLHGLIASNHFVGLGEGGHLYSSADGHTWAALATITGAGTFNAGLYAAPKYVAVGDAGYIAVSPDGSAWAASQVVVVGGSGVNLHGVAYDGTHYIVVGDNGTIATSTDGYAWTPVTTSALTGTLRSVAVSASGEIVVVGDSGIETSKDTTHWHVRDEAGAAALYNVRWLNGQFVAVGGSSAIKTSAH
jgi:photosystem II stability/assembly factor-like uncharacterized protein